MKELKPCPFCHNSGEVFVPETRYWSVRCKMAGCVSDTGYHTCKEDAIIYWNTRAITAKSIAAAYRAVLKRRPFPSVEFYEEMEKELHK